MTITKCGNCGKTLNETSSLPEEERKPCPICGSKLRLFHVMLQETVIGRDKIGIKARHGSKGKPFKESVHGSDLFHKTGEWNTKSQIIDRENNLYSEVIKDNTGKIIHECIEPLSEHKGHGSAKKKKGK